MKRLRNKALFVFVLVFSIALSGCFGDRNEPESTTDDTLSETQIQEGGTLRVGISQDLDSLDPHLASSAGTREVLFNIYEGLVKITSDAQLIPAVAQEFTISDDATVYTFVLREGIRFHNGELVTVEDVKYSIERNAGTDGGDPKVAAFSIIQAVNILDERTVEILLEEPTLELLAALTVAIVPKGVEDLNLNPIGTGPFKFVSRSLGQNVIIDRFDDYWGNGANLDRVELRIVADANMIVTNLLGGSIDMFLRLTASQAAELNEEFNIEKGTMNLVQALYLNNDFEPLNDVRVRQALGYAIDPDEIIAMVGGGYGVRVGSSMYPAFLRYFDEDLVYFYPQDFERAKELLAEAGFPDGFDLEITVSQADQPHMDASQVIVEQLRNINVNATIRPVEWSVWLEEVHGQRNYQATVVGVDARNLSARAMLERFVTGASGNFVNFSDAEYDSVFAKAVAATDPDEQLELYKHLQFILADRAANVYIQDLSNLVAIRNTFSGYVFYPLFVQDFSTIYMIERQ